MPIQSRYYGQSTPVLTKNNIRKVQSYTPTTSQSITPSNISKDETSKSKWFKKSKLLKKLVVIIGSIFLQALSLCL